MGFAENWTHIAAAPQPPTLKDKLDRMDTIQGLPRIEDNSVHCVHIVHRDSIQDDLSKGASAPGPDTGLEWLPGPPAHHASFDAWWAAFDLADLCRIYGVRIIYDGASIIAAYQRTSHPDLISYASGLLLEALDYLHLHADKIQKFRQR